MPRSSLAVTGGTGVNGSRVTSALISCYLLELLMSRNQILSFFSVLQDSMLSH